jgi:hypothetical protein
MSARPSFHSTDVLTVVDEIGLEALVGGSGGVGHVDVGCVDWYSRFVGGGCSRWGLPRGSRVYEVRL